MATVSKCLDKMSRARGSSPFFLIAFLLFRTTRTRTLLSAVALGHPAKNDHATEALHNFCTRATFLRGVPEWLSSTVCL